MIWPSALPCASLLFAAVTLVYTRRSRHFPPLKTATTFLAVVIALDLFVVALLIEKGFDMFKSLLGTWLPFLLIFLATRFTATLAHRKS